MEISSANIRERINGVWDKLRFIVVSDEKYWMPCLGEFSEKLREFLSLKYVYINNLFECEEFAISFMNHCRETRAIEAISGNIPENECLNWPMGVVVGNKFDGEAINHWACLILLEDIGPLLVDPQDGKKWIPKADRDNIYFILI